MRIAIYCLMATFVVTAVTAQPCVAQSKTSTEPTYTVEQYADAGKQRMPIIMKVTLPPAQMKKMADMMRAGYNNCYVEDLDPGDDSSMLMICGVQQPAESFVP
jgi:hypothetical protein